MVCRVVVGLFGALSLSHPSRALSTASTSGLVWSDAAIQLVKSLSMSEREKLLAEDDGFLRQQPIRITAERVDASSSLDNGITSMHSDDGTTRSKIVHFQRHGQGYHNLLGDILRDAGVNPDIDSKDPSINPWIRPEIVDAPLTETGKWQCEQQRSVASNLNLELVVVSPLARTIQTAKLSFVDYYGSPLIPWIAHEACREEMGVLTCNKRRPLSQIMAEFPDLQYNEMTEQDTLWNAASRESHLSKSERIYDFLVNFIAQREEFNIAVVTHSAWLFHTLNAVVDCGNDLCLASWFLTGEIRSVKLTFSSSSALT